MGFKTTKKVYKLVREDYANKHWINKTIEVKLTNEDLSILLDAIYEYEDLDTKKLRKKLEKWVE